MSSEAKPYRYWYSRKMHAHLALQAGRGEWGNVGELASGKYFTSCAQIDGPPLAWDDYVLVGETDEWSATMHPANSVPLQEYQP